MKQLILPILCGLALAACDDRARKPPAAETAVTDDHAGHAGLDHAPVAVGPYRMTASPATPIEAGTPAAMTFELLAPDGSRVGKLTVAHEKLLHLIIVSKDLAFFAHQHPVQQPDGRLLLDVTFPAPGDYLLFGDFTPEGGAQAIARTPITVAGTAPAATALVSAPLPSHATFGDFEVTLSSAAPLIAGGAAMLGFEVRAHGALVTDLRNYLGARGHCVIIGEDSTTFLHSHPMGAADAPKVEFHTVFPKPGRYKVWAELRPGGATLIASFVVDVAPGLAPAPPIDER